MTLPYKRINNLGRYLAVESAVDIRHQFQVLNLPKTPCHPDQAEGAWRDLRTEMTAKILRLAPLAQNDKEIL